MSMSSTERVWRGRAIEVGWHLCTAGPEDRPFEEQHRRSVLAFVVSGAFQYRLSAAETVSLGPGSVLIGGRGQSYVCSHDFGRGDRCLSFSFDEAALDDVRSSVSPRAPLRRPSLPAGPRTMVLLGAAESAAAARDGAALEEIGYSLAALTLTSQAGGAAPPPSARDRRRALDAMQFVDEHAADPLTLDEVAAQVGSSPFHFLRGFRAVAGVTPHQYLVAARLKRAAHLLTATDRPITDVAFECGFGDLSNFIRTFRRAAGTTPSEFRRRRATL